MQRIITQVVLTKDLSAPSEDSTGDLNQKVAAETRKAIQHSEAGKMAMQPFEEL